MEEIKVLLIEGQSDHKEVVLETLSNLDELNLIGVTEDMETADNFVDSNHPNIMIIGTTLDFDRHSFAKSISSEFNDIAIIMVEDELKEDTMFNVLASGAKDVIISPLTVSKLEESLRKVSQLVQEELAKPSEIGVSTKEYSMRGHVVTVFSTKGGVGKTFVATNLAVSLAKNTNQSVCLVDFDLDFGNAALALNVPPKFTILDIVDNIKNMNQDVIESYLIPHESGIMVLPANERPQSNEFVNAEHIEIILKTLRGAFDYVVVDMPARFDEPVNPAFQAADLLLMVTTPDISAVRNIKASIETLYELNFPKSKLKVLLNKADASKKITVKDVESTLNQDIYSAIPFDNKQVILSLNTGIPLTISKPKSAIAKSFGDLSNLINIDLKGNEQIVEESILLTE